MFVGGVAVQTQAKKSAELCLLLIIRLQKLTFEGKRKKSLDQIGGVVRSHTPAEAGVFVKGRPIGTDEKIERTIPFTCVTR